MGETFFACLLNHQMSSASSPSGSQCFPLTVILVNNELVLRARHCSKLFIYINRFNPRNTLRRYMLSLSVLKVRKLRLGVRKQLSQGPPWLKAEEAGLKPRPSDFRAFSFNLPNNMPPGLMEILGYQEID